jgi:4a-hydroxytetrahydrobiopterin dehydratase
MRKVESWENTGLKLYRRYEFKNFKQALAFTNAVGAIAEEQKHHPDIELGWGYCAISITTHDANNSLTDKDFDLALKINQI